MVVYGIVECNTFINAIAVLAIIIVRHRVYLL